MNLNDQEHQLLLELLSFFTEEDDRPVEISNELFDSMYNKVLNYATQSDTKEYEALILLVEEEQLIMIDDEENEFWNTIRRKLKHFSNKK